MQSQPDPTNAVTQQKFNELLEILDQLNEENREYVLRFIKFRLSNYADKFIGRATMAYELMRDLLFMPVSLVLCFCLSGMILEHISEIPKTYLVVALLTVFFVSLVITDLIERLFDEISYQIQKRLYGC
jgi:hypothetical protein